MIKKKKSTKKCKIPVSEKASIASGALRARSVNRGNQNAKAVLPTLQFDSGKVKWQKCEKQGLCVSSFSAAVPEYISCSRKLFSKYKRDCAFNKGRNRIKTGLAHFEVFLQTALS